MKFGKQTRRVRLLLKWVDKTANQRGLARLAKRVRGWEYRDVGTAAAQKITDSELLSDVLKNARHTAVREIACGKLGHMWNGCKCSSCGKTRDEQHDLDGCVCRICGKTVHVFVSEICERCGTADKSKEVEAWDGSWHNSDGTSGIGDITW